MATKPTTRTASRSGAKSSKTPAPPGAALDNALFVPRLDLLELPEEAMHGTGPDYSMLLESICGVIDDSQPVEQYDGTLGVTQAFVNAHQLPVAQVQWNDNLASVFTNPGNVNGVRWGSGTMIGPDLFLTCGHLFDPDPNGWTIPRQNGTSNPISPQQAATNMHVNFEYQVDAGGNLRAEQRFAITQLVEYRLGGLDMALCRIAGSPGNVYGWTEFATTNAAVGDMLAIIGHPAGQPKRVEAGPLTQLSGSVVRYDDIDTLGGNSGSGILHSPSGRLVGVHTNGGCNSAGTGSNSGVAIAAIVAASPTLQSITPSSSTARAADVIATNLAADALGTRLASDVGTAKAADTGLRDQLGTPLAADVLGTAFAFDTGLRDRIGTHLAGDIGTFGSGDDPNLTRVEGIVDPGLLLRDPTVLGSLVGAVGVRPFVQAGPSAVAQSAGEAAGESLGEVVLAELEALIAANTAALESLQAVYAALQDAENGHSEP